MMYDVAISPVSIHQWRRDWLCNGCYPVACEAFGVSPSAEFQADVEAHIINASGIVVSHEEGNINGFMCWNYIPFNQWDTILYLSGIAVHPAFQGNGLMKNMISRIILEDIKRSLPDEHALVPLPRYSWVVMRTQSPKVKQAVDGAIGKVSYPNGTNIPADVQLVAHYSMQTLQQDCDDSLIVKGAYGHSLYPPERKPLQIATNDEYNRAFSAVNMDEGDSQVCVWRR